MPLDVLGHIDTNIAKLGVCGGLARGDDGSERGWRGKVWGSRDSKMAGLKICNGQLSSLTERATTSLKLIVVDRFMFT